MSCPKNPAYTDNNIPWGSVQSEHAKALQKLHVPYHNHTYQVIQIMPTTVKSSNYW